MLAWTHRKRPESWIARTATGTALIHVVGTGVVTLDMWRPDQKDIGRGVFPSVEAAKVRAEAVLDHRFTSWDLLGDFLPEDEGQ